MKTEHFSMFNCLVRQYRNEVSANLCQINGRRNTLLWVQRVRTLVRFGFQSIKHASRLI